MSKAHKDPEYLRNRDIILAGKPACSACHKPMLYADDFPEGQRDRWWLHPKAATVDHIILVVDGGTHALSNLRPMHRGCNSKRNRRHHTVVRPLREQLFGRPRLNSLDG